MYIYDAIIKLFIPQAVATLQKTSNGHRMLLKFLQYAQSSQCYTSSDSSVSYAAASLIFE